MDKEIAFSLIEYQAFHQEQSLATAHEKSKEWRDAETASIEAREKAEKVRQRRREIQEAKEAYREKERVWKAERAANRLADKKFRYELLMEKQARIFARRNGLVARDALHEPRKPLPRSEEYRLIVDVIKTAAVCTDCGKDWEPVALSFDHIPERGAKSFSISQGVKSKRSIETLMEEMAKCEIVCHSCHAIRTNNRIKSKKLQLA